MKTKQNFAKFLFAFTLGGLILTGCKKQEEEDTDTSASSDNATAEAYYNDLGNIADEGAVSGSISSYKNGMGNNNVGLLSACATVSFDTLNHSNADSVTIDFGSSNCLCIDGRYRRGKILVTFTGKYRDSSTVITITPNNYFVNDNQLLGSKTVTNMGRNTAGNLYHSIVVNGQIVLANGGGTITWNANKQREWTAGEGTMQWNDDMYSITGTANGTSAKGTSYMVTITSPLIRNMALGCRKHFVQGTFDLTPSGKPVRTVDFGTGACDNLATVTINGNVYTITLK